MPTQIALYTTYDAATESIYMTPFRTSGRTNFFLSSNFRCLTKRHVLWTQLYPMKCLQPSLEHHLGTAVVTSAMVSTAGSYHAPTYIPEREYDANKTIWFPINGDFRHTETTIEQLGAASLNSISVLYFQSSCTYQPRKSNRNRKIIPATYSISIRRFDK